MRDEFSRFDSNGIKANRFLCMYAAPSGTVLQKYELSSAFAKHRKACGSSNHNKQTVKLLHNVHPQACHKKKRPAGRGFAST
jgi:hypothetical protein